ncbi:MAG: Hpt domain-containing protein [Opitutales bacterium]
MAFPEPDTDLPLFDRAYLENLFGDGDGVPPEMVQELYSLFEPENAAKLADIRPRAEAGDADAVMGGAHFIAGSAANLGLSRLSTLARAHEVAIEEGATDRLPERVAAIQAVFDETRSAFRQAFRPDESTG